MGISYAKWKSFGIVIANILWLTRPNVVNVL